MIIPDANLLIYAHDSTSPFHSRASVWWLKCLSENESVGLPEVVVFAFLRIITNPRICKAPLKVDEATALVRNWLSKHHIGILLPIPNHAELVMKNLEKLGTAGNLVTDVQIATIALHHGAILHTADTDFDRFTQLRKFNPFGP